MRALVILYHDVVGDDFDESGFPGPAAARYKLTERDFAEHLECLVRGTPSAFGVVSSDGDAGGMPRLFTVDDGGVSSLHIADRLEERGWQGHFFITTDYIGTPGFLTAEQLLDLHRRGHVIGSHSCSHPPRISDLPPDQLASEWRDSVAKLSDVLGAAVVTASVPGGYYSAAVARAAASAGIIRLFTSEPTLRVRRVGGCEVFGRYSIFQGVSASTAGAMVAGGVLSRGRQTVVWNMKKLLKRVARPVWERGRTVYFRARPAARSDSGDRRNDLS